MSTASALSPTSSTPSSSSMIAGSVSASTRRPASARAAARGVVWISSSSSSIDIARSSVASVARERVVLLVTKRSRWPASRKLATASAAPGIGRPDTWRTPSTSSRMADMQGESIRVTRSVVLPVSEVDLRFSRSSGPGGQHANTSETRVEASFEVEASTALTDGQKRRVVEGVAAHERLEVAHGRARRDQLLELRLGVVVLTREQARDEAVTAEIEGDRVAVVERAADEDLVELVDVAEDLEGDAEDLGEERRDDVVAAVAAGDQFADVRPLMVRVRPVLDPAVTLEQRVVEPRDVAD